MIQNLFKDVASPTLRINNPFFESNNLMVDIIQEYLLHPEVSGNKWRKLKYNVQQAIKQDKGILTFGGAYSNHIAATAAAGKHFNIPTIGIIRGEELNANSNPTLKQASAYNMDLIFVSRKEYRDRNQAEYLNDLSIKYPDYIIIPEGGCNSLGIKGCEEILKSHYDLTFVAAGTGSTAAGIINSQKSTYTKVVSVLKGDFLREQVQRMCEFDNWELLTDYHFGGYAKSNDSLKSFQGKFEKEYGVLLDPVYTAKTFYAAFDYLRKNQISNKRIAIVHTGGLQGR